MRARFRLTRLQVPYFNAPIFLENKSQVGKVEEIFGKVKESVRALLPAIVCLGSLGRALVHSSCVSGHNASNAVLHAPCISGCNGMHASNNALPLRHCTDSVSIQTPWLMRIVS